MLHEFITANRGEIIARTRSKVALRSAPRPTQRELETGVPLFLDQLAAALREGGRRLTPQDMRAIGATAAMHGGNLLEQGFTISQVVHGYGDVCQALTELAQETEASITTEEFHGLNLCLDDAIAQAVTEYMRLREQAITDEGTMRSGMLAHELRNRLSAASVGFELIKRGTVATGGSVGALVSRNLLRIGSLIHRSLVEVRLHSGIEYRERVSVAELIEEAEVDGALEAAASHLALTVTTVDREVAVDVDRQIVAGAIANLMQNAFKFTRPQGPGLAADVGGRRSRPDRGRGRVRGVAAGEGRGAVRRLSAAGRRPHRAGPRVVHQPQGRRGKPGLDWRAGPAREGMRLHHRPAQGDGGGRGGGHLTPEAELPGRPLRQFVGRGCR